MSLEQVLMIALFVVLPLIQYLMQQVRERNKLPEKADGGLPPSTKLPPVQKQQPALSQHARPAASGAMVAPADYSNMRAAPTEYQSAQRTGVVTGLANPFGARRAIVFLTLIGPCRAASPHGWPDNRSH